MTRGKTRNSTNTDGGSKAGDGADLTALENTVFSVHNAFEVLDEMDSFLGKHKSPTYAHDVVADVSLETREGESKRL